MPGGNEHSTYEYVGYLTIKYETVDFNIALLVDDEPKGILQEIEKDVRLGISVYNYEQDRNLYFFKIKRRHIKD